jgi:hypothetical protein
MHGRKVWWLVALAATAGAVTLSLSRGQERSKTGSDAGPAPLTLELSPAQSTQGANVPPSGPDLSKYNPLQKQMYLSASRGADWLARANRSDGRFVYGYLPALKANLEGDHYLRQVGAAVALAREARFTGNERHAAIARQTVLTLLLDTTIDTQSRLSATAASSDPGVSTEGKTPMANRYTTFPSILVNRLAAAGLLVLAINELPSPGEDLLQQSEQLCAFIGQQQRADGSLCYNDAQPDTPPEPAAIAEDPDGINYYPGEALYGLMRSYQRRPAAWKTSAVRKALNYYFPWWRAHKNMALVPWHTAAYAEAFLLTKDQAFADAVNEMSDWICSLQYVSLDPRHPFWAGGFMSWVDGKPAPTVPQVSSASYAEGLAEACRLAREIGDVTRYKRYRESLERALQFLATLQYSDATTQHFADWYRPTLLGGFFASHQDGNLRIDYTQHAVCAMVQYLAYVGD